MGRRLAAISDIHGNLPALEAVLEEMSRDKPDLIVVCGDVAAGPMPSETIDALMRLEGARFVRGNADRALIERFDGEPAPAGSPAWDWCAKQLTRAQRDFLASFAETIAVDDVDGIGRVLFCHATPRNDTDVMTVETPDEEMRPHLEGVDAAMVVCGHTHMQFDRTVDSIRVVNAGSVGMTYGRPGAYWAWFGPGLTLRRTEYDLTSAARRIRSKDWPMAEDFAENNVVHPPSKEEAMEFMRSIELKRRASPGA